MKTLKILLAAALLVSMTSAPATAALLEPIITATSADTDTMTLLIEGLNLPKGAVFMGRVGGGVEKLNVISADSKVIKASLLTAEPGTYLVAVAMSAKSFWTSNVTIGAIGPAGPEGPAFDVTSQIYAVVEDFSFHLLTNIGHSTFVACNEGDIAIGGGMSLGAPPDIVFQNVIFWDDSYYMTGLSRYWNFTARRPAAVPIPNPIPVSLRAVCVKSVN